MALANDLPRFQGLTLVFYWRKYRIYVTIKKVEIWTGSSPARDPQHNMGIPSSRRSLKHDAGAIRIGFISLLAVQYGAREELVQYRLKDQG